VKLDPLAPFLPASTCPCTQHTPRYVAFFHVNRMATQPLRHRAAGSRRVIYMLYSDSEEEDQSPNMPATASPGPEEDVLEENEPGTPESYAGVEDYEADEHEHEPQEHETDEHEHDWLENESDENEHQHQHEDQHEDSAEEQEEGGKKKRKKLIWNESTRFSSRCELSFSLFHLFLTPHGRVGLIWTAG
jgi:hypothetical protein